MTNFDRADPSAPVHLVCYGTGGASIASADGSIWCATTRFQGWHSGEDIDQHARYFMTIDNALAFARGMGWIGE